jgi:chromosome segregation protein
VFLKALTIKGFKSFADATTLDFEPGVTVVVGPNGSGKSNVVDAVAWVLGAQGPRTVRSTKMEEVIFAGTPNRPPLGRAEVSLTIDNSAGLLPIDFSEVTITRTLYRSGESEYAINRVPCRLLDIQDLLSDTGVGRQQHVIVSQGNIDAILNARPEERRLVIEEAAGILKYRRRKEKAERRLESTEASLVRLQDLLREVRRTLRPLEKQAEAARRHGEVNAELTALRRHLLGRDLAAVESRRSVAAHNRRDLARSEEEVRRALAHLDAEILTAEAAVEEQLAASSGPDIAEMVSRAESLRARAAGLSALISERRRSIERALSSKVDQDVIASLEAEATALAERLASTEAEAAALLPQADEITQAEAALGAQAATVEAVWGTETTVATDPAGEVRGELSVLLSAEERTAVDSRRLHSRLGSLSERVARLHSEADRLRAVVAGAVAEAPLLAAAERDAAERDDAALAAVRQAEEARRVSEAEGQRWGARQEALSQALDQARARAGAERLAGVAGVVGTLVELVEVDEGYEQAFEAAAGEALAAVIVDGAESARRGFAELHRRSDAGAVLSLMSSWSLGIPAPLPPGRIPLRGRVRLRARMQDWSGSEAVGTLLDSLLSRAVVVEDGWEAASYLATSRPDLIVVTPDGDRFVGGLWRTGATGAGATRAALDEARGQAEVALARVSAAAVALADARREADLSREGRLAATRAVDANASRRQATADALGRVETDIADARQELADLQAQREEVGQRLVREQARIAELEALLPELQRLAAAEAERAAAERSARFQLAERTAVVNGMRRELEVRVAGLEERRTFTARRLSEVEERLRSNVAEREAAAVRRESAQAAAEVADRLLDFVRGREAELDGVVVRLREARRIESDSSRERAGNLEALRRSRGVAERQLGEVRERLSRIDLEEAESMVRLEAITESIRRDLDCEPDSVRGAPCPPLPPGTSATARRSELERELRLMGPINPLAVEEHAALQERHMFLEAQLEDVRSARRELAKVIKAVDAEIVEVFAAAYADVADHFEKLFATLFPGGEGRLRLTEPDHLLETGIEIEARPSGKNLRRLSLLSGGERSLAAMAFLFAVFRARPSPFYMLDEVEAALDDVNLHRFLDLIREFRDEAQLLIVTHQKRTMEAGDCLYGVTMAPGASSRVVSERVTAPAG